MADLIYLTGIVMGTYLSSVAFIGLMIKVFFPLKTKEEWARINSLQPIKNHQRVPRIRRAAHSIMNESRQLA